jgi:hypothetical protein
MENAAGKRRIDDAKRGKVNEYSDISGKIFVASGMLPVVLAKIMVRYIATTAPVLLHQRETRLLSGGEDQPDTYHWLPADPQDLDVSNVAIFSPSKSDTFSRRSGGHFSARRVQRRTSTDGFPSSSRASKDSWGHLGPLTSTIASPWTSHWQEEKDRRLGGKSSRRSGRRCIHLRLAIWRRQEAYGPGAQSKQMLKDGLVSLTPPPAVQGKALGLIAKALGSNSLTPAQAGKPHRGSSSWPWACKVGKPGLTALKQRMFWRAPLWSLAKSLRGGLTNLKKVLLREDLGREVQLLRTPWFQ